MQTFADQVDPSVEPQGSDSGVQVGTLELPIPGFYVLAPGGKVLGKCRLDSLEDCLALLRTHARP